MTKEKEDRLDEFLTGQIGQWRDHWLDTLPPVTQPHAFSPASEYSLPSHMPLIITPESSKYLAAPSITISPVCNAPSLPK